MCFWLAIIIRGKSQHVRINSGVDRESVAMYGFRVDHPVSDVLINQERLANAIVRLWAREAGQSHLCGVSQIIGNSISVGMRIFSIVVN